VPGYPKEWEHHDLLPDGRRVFVRPLRPEDAALYPDFIAAVTAQDLRLRFFTAVRELSAAQIAKLTRLDYDRAMAFIALEPDSGDMLGVVRLHRESEGTGEYAVLVRSALKGRGLGWLLMRRMIGYARAAGLTRIQGQVLTENATMLRMCTELGFTIADDPAGSFMKVVTLDLEAAPKAA
jgi:RimJ/RimL family protein N-acetyltransferase